MKIFVACTDIWERIHLVHDTCYSYSQPVRFPPHWLVLRPREGHEVLLHSMSLTTAPLPVSAITLAA
ncbi:MAG: transglutaminase N-terminal domain-containing protein [Luteolibacter sp.]